MIAFEIAFLMFLGVVIVVAIAAGGRPLAEAYAEQLKVKHRALGSDTERIYDAKISVLQQEVADLKERIAYLENAVGFDASVHNTTEKKAPNPADKSRKQ